MVNVYLQLVFALFICRDERIVSRAIELNEQLQKVLARHDDLVSGRATTTAAAHFDHEEEAEEEEEPEQLVRRCLLSLSITLYFEYQFHLSMANVVMPCRLRKGKACARPEDEETETDISCMGLLGDRDRLNRPLIRPVSIEPSREAHTRSPPAVIPPPPRPKLNGELPHVAIPPPPAKHIERERFFQENKDASTLSSHIRGLSLHSRNGSSSHSHSGSFDFSE